MKRRAGAAGLNLWISLIVMLYACEAEPEFITRFHIPKGEHYALPRSVESLQRNHLVFTATFDSSAVYHLDNKAYQDSKNKLLGFSDCNSLHRVNSARFAWQWFNERLEIFAYCYVNGVRVEEFIGSVELNKPHHYSITCTAEHYVFRLDAHEPVVIRRGNVCDKGWYYMLWPYFGGSQPAPHDIRITIKRYYW